MHANGYLCSMLEEAWLPSRLPTRSPTFTASNFACLMAVRKEHRDSLDNSFPIWLTELAQVAFDFRYRHCSQSLLFFHSTSPFVVIIARQKRGSIHSAKQSPSS